ncbi:MAG: FHA domain-containing protein, partial [Candidatus Adiutrix sp.]
MSVLKLILSAESGTGETWEFAPPKSILIGRDKYAKVNPSSDNGGQSRLSAYHAVIELSSEKAFVRDLGSLNGTILNSHLVGERPSETRYKSGTPITGMGVCLSDGDI